jgi:hypothetical protein
MTLPTSGSCSSPYELTSLRILLTSVWSYSPPYDLTHLRILFTSVLSYLPPYDLTHLRILFTFVYMILLTSVWSYSPPSDLTHLCSIKTLLTSVRPDSPPYDRTLPWAAHLPPPHSSHRCCRWIWSAQSRAKIKGQSTEIFNPRHPHSPPHWRGCTEQGANIKGLHKKPSTKVDTVPRMLSLVSHQWCDLFYRLLHSYTRHIERVVRGERDTLLSAQEWGHGGVAWGDCVSQSRAGRVTLSRHTPPLIVHSHGPKISDFRKSG